MKLHFDSALLSDGWTEDVTIEIDRDGVIAAIGSSAVGADSEHVDGAAVPGMPNLHCHAFQRAMAGLTEVAGPTDDSFWTWREWMYRFANRLQPEDAEAIAAQLYVEMLCAGYTAVGEFHYVHHQPNGQPYAEPEAMSARVIAAAKRSGIGITHLPVLYAHAGLGGQPATDGQRRFLNDADAFLDLVERLAQAHAGDPTIAVGIAPHSLRAVTPDLLNRVVEDYRDFAPGGPIHIHIAEQQKEVDDCVAWSGARPVEWLLRHMAVDMRWCLVHATHVSDDERRRLAACGAVAGLCPTTEANLGDGVFPARSFLMEHGRIGIGSDSNVSVDPAEELRLLEYGQRLTRQRRNVLTDGAGDHTGARLYKAALGGGAQALGRPVGALAAGRRADIVVLDTDHPALYGRSGDRLLDAWVFAGQPSPVREVYTGGRRRVAQGRHVDADGIAADYRAAIDRLLAE